MSQSLEEYSILVFVSDDYVELVRQPQQWLKDTFNFDRIGGYTILGRRSLLTNDSELIVKSLWSSPRHLMGLIMSLSRYRCTMKLTMPQDF